MFKKQIFDNKKNTFADKNVVYGNKLTSIFSYILYFIIIGLLLLMLIMCSLESDTIQQWLYTMVNFLPMPLSYPLVMVAFILEMIPYSCLLFAIPIALFAYFKSKNKSSYYHIIFACVWILIGIILSVLFHGKTELKCWLISCSNYAPIFQVQAGVFYIVFGSVYLFRYAFKK